MNDTSTHTSDLKAELKAFKGKLKQHFAELTDDDLTFLDGKREELMAELERRTGKTRSDIREKIKNIEL